MLLLDLNGLRIPRVGWEKVYYHQSILENIYEFPTRINSFRSLDRKFKRSSKQVHKSNELILGLSNDISQLFFKTDSTQLLEVFINQANIKPESSFDNYNGHRQKIQSILNDVTHHHFSQWQYIIFPPTYLFFFKYSCHLNFFNLLDSGQKSRENYQQIPTTNMYTTHILANIQVT